MYACLLLTSEVTYHHCKLQKSINVSTNIYIILFFLNVKPFCVNLNEYWHIDRNQLLDRHVVRNLLLENNLCKCHIADNKCRLFKIQFSLPWTYIITVYFGEFFFSKLIRGDLPLIVISRVQSVPWVEMFQDYFEHRVLRIKGSPLNVIKL